MAVPRRTLAALRRIARQNGVVVDATTKALAASWVAAWDDLSPAWRQAIEALVDQYQRTGKWPAPWQVARIGAIADAQQRTERSLTALIAESATAVRRAAVEVSAFTGKAQLDLIGSQLAGSDPSAPAKTLTQSALGARQKRITDLHRPVGPAALASIRHVLARPPRPSATPPAKDLYGRIRAGFDTGFTRASTIAGTELVDTYRTAASLVDNANSGALDGWAWFCTCDLASCIACWVMHGQVFPLRQPGPEGHPTCRCARLPLAAGATLPTAEAKFRRLSRREQLGILGPARFELWRTRQVTWADLTIRRSHTGWRDSHVPRPVADLQRIAVRSSA